MNKHNRDACDEVLTVRPSAVFAVRALECDVQNTGDSYMPYDFQELLILF